ncbi:hypothetical protein SAMN05892877_11737 [Rhizobium subbaraonis]|uniref:Uncharacterized protein n=1 Tax=Rhizobium subbaraonis TaxID=908946 RepID=A0A285UUZ3_9HYPH|nr:hypothetical protein [Rhizobium subbaraonis]SOC45652.1 hypothetical protein SAMN05892877_11737 [Rhizobium subbaraonis]
MATHHEHGAQTPLSTRTIFAKATIRAAERARRMRRRLPEAGGRRHREREGARVRFGIVLALIAAGTGWLILFG